MSKQTRPKIVISKCLGFAVCRYDGAVITNRFVEDLQRYVQFLPVCPEMAIGLGVPRAPIRIVAKAGRLRLIQAATKKDLTKKMENFTESFLASVKDIDGFILKSDSPTCGLKGVKIYKTMNDRKQISKGTGFFAKSILDRFSAGVVIDERGLRDTKKRGRFLKRIFASMKKRVNQ